MHYSKGQMMKTFGGTPAYIAPEIWNLENGGDGYGLLADWWAYGVILYEMMTGYLPFDGNTQTEFKLMITMHGVYYPKTMYEPSETDTDKETDLLEGLLKKNPEERLGFRDEEDIKSHHFFQAIDWKKVESREMEPPFKPVSTDDKNDTSNFD